MSQRTHVPHSRLSAGVKRAAAAMLLLGLGGCVVAPLPYHHGYHGRGAAPAAYPYSVPEDDRRDGRYGRHGWRGGRYEGERRGYD